MSFPTKHAIRQDKLAERRGPVSRPTAIEPIQHTMGPGSKFTQDKYGTSGFMDNPPWPGPKLTPSKSDVFGSQAAQCTGFKLSKRSGK
jgi:hypothetical protein